MARLSVFFTIVLFLFDSCSPKPKTNAELIVGTWKMKVDKDTGKITFYKDLTIQMTNTRSMAETKSGTYKLVHDGKYLDTWEKGRSDSDELEIISINDTTLQLRDTKDSHLFVLTKDISK